MRAARSAWIVGDGVRRRVVGEVRQELLDEEGVALRGGDYPVANGRRELVGERVDELVRVPRPSGSSTTSVAPGLGAAQVGRTSKRSGRAVQRTKIRPPLDEAATYSIRSSSAGSAQWMSSTTTTSGLLSASVSKSRRNAQAVSSGEPPPSRVPTAP